MTDYLISCKPKLKCYFPFNLNKVYVIFLKTQLQSIL